ncbi:MAG TPA: D-alanyl-D-alanine carboxypeptidase family protein [Tissierellales bacterium]|nr:D-alanyl-D-alanine carboxypeptidase family protein [Tissierellales bacterium]
MMMKMNKKYIILSIGVCLLLFSGTIGYADGVKVHGEGVILMDTDSGRVLYEYNPYSELSMASTTKIMTALVALENGNLDDIVTIKKSSVGIEGSSIYLYEEEEISLEDLLYGLMLRSGNDAAIAIAEFIGGSVDGFVELMNKKAKEIGARNTNFTNPHGLSDENHYTTSYDLTIITRAALKNENFNKIVKTQKWVANREKNQYFYNKNKTLWQYEGGDGVKTGYTKKAGRCLVASATRNDLQLISTVLNDGNWFNDCYELLDYGFQNFSQVIIYDAGQYVENVEVINGNKDKVPIVTKNSFTYPLRKEEIDKITVFYKLPPGIEAPIKKGEEIGEISVYLDGKLIHTEKMITKENINKLNILEKMLKNL